MHVETRGWISGGAPQADPRSLPRPLRESVPPDPSYRSGLASVERPGLWAVRPVVAIIATMTAGAALVGAATGLHPAMGLGAFAVVALGAVAVTSARPVHLALLLAIAAPTLNGLARGMPIPGLRFTELLIVGIGVLVLLCGSPHAAVPWRAFDWAAMIYVTATVVIGSYNVMENGGLFTSDVVGSLFSPLQYFLLYRVIVTGIRTPGRLKQALRWTLLASIGIGFLGLLQQLDIGPTRSVIGTLTGNAAYFQSWQFTNFPRATGLFPFYHSLAAYMMLVILLAAGLLVEDVKGILSRRMLVVVLVCAGGSLMTTATLSPMMGALLGLVVIGISSGRLVRAGRWIVLGAVLLGVLAAPLLSSRLDAQIEGSDSGLVPQTVEYRVDVWRDQFLPALSGDWLSGYGPTLPDSVEWEHTESLYLTLIVLGGLPLLAAFGALMWALFFRARDAVRHRAPGSAARALGHTLAATVIALIPMNLMWPYFSSLGLPHLLWVLAGLLMSAVKHDESFTVLTRQGAHSPV